MNNEVTRRARCEPLTNLKLRRYPGKFWVRVQTSALLPAMQLTQRGATMVVAAYFLDFSYGIIKVDGAQLFFWYRDPRISFDEVELI